MQRRNFMNSCYVLIKETNLDPIGQSKTANSYCASKTVKVFSDFENAKSKCVLS